MTEVNRYQQVFRKRQFVGVVQKWGLKKNTNQKQRELILEKLNEDQGAKEVGTFAINQRKLKRWKKKDINPIQPTTGTVARVTHISRQPAAPMVFQLPENLFASINIYVTASIESQTWVTFKNGPSFNIVKHGNREPDVSYLDSFNANCVAARDFIRKDSFVEARKSLSNACSLMRQILESEDPHAIWYFIMSFFQMRTPRIKVVDEAFAVIRGYLGRLAMALLPAGHPWRNICCLIASVELDQLDGVLSLMMECIAKVFEARLGRFHETTFLCIQEHIGALRYPNSLEHAEMALRELIVEVQHHLGPSRQLFGAIEKLCVNLRAQKRYAESEIESEKYLALARANKNQNKIVNSLLHLTQAQYYQGKHLEAEATMRECAATVLTVPTSDSVTWAVFFLTRLERWLREWGRDADADTLKDEIAAMVVEPTDVIEEVGSIK